jgi:ribulose kinase
MWGFLLARQLMNRRGRKQTSERQVLGTTSSRAIVFEHGGAIRAAAQKEFQQIFPQPGWVEHNPREIWSSQLEVARTALAQAGIKAGDLAAIGITNQRETTVLWDRGTELSDLLQKALAEFICGSAVWVTAKAACSPPL